MANLELTKELLEAAVLGGCVLGGGGGGSMEKGRSTARLGLELRAVTLIDPEDMDDNEVLINVSNVGAPSAKNAYVEPMDNAKVVTMLCDSMGIKAGGIITNEAGGSATVNGWLQCAILGLPLVDAPCNGRAHPTGIMGSMGLHRVPDYISFQAAAGGKKENGRHVEMVVSGDMNRVAKLVREAAVQADGLVAVARNPVTCDYAKTHGACGAVRQAIELGQAMLKAQPEGGDAVLQAICDFLGGQIVAKGEISHLELKCSGGFDTGIVQVGHHLLTFWNEYMTLEQDGTRLGTFPDLIMTLDGKTGLPVTSAEVVQGQEIAILLVPKENIKLGDGMKDPELFKGCGEAVGKDIISYAFPK